jgi:hypothetical protein
VLREDRGLVTVGLFGGGLKGDGVCKGKQMGTECNKMKLNKLFPFNMSQTITNDPTDTWCVCLCVRAIQSAQH